MSSLTPFADDAASVTIGKMTVENGTDRLAVYGSLDITRDKPGLAHARELLAMLQEAVRVMEADPSLPATAPTAIKPRTVANPFA